MSDELSPDFKQAIQKFVELEGSKVITSLSRGERYQVLRYLYALHLPCQEIDGNSTFRQLNSSVRGVRSNSHILVTNPTILEMHFSEGEINSLSISPEDELTLIEMKPEKVE